MRFFGEISLIIGFMINEIGIFHKLIQEIDMKKKALIVQGGWDGHEPVLVAELCKAILEKHDFEVQVSDTLDSFADEEALKKLSLIVPVWTMGDIKYEYCLSVLASVASGVGLAGCHGGMCDSFRQNVDWQFMTGGQWVAHPGNDGVEYKVRIINGSHQIVEGLEDFTVRSEQYYMHVDPAVKVHAVTRFPVVEGPHSGNGPVDMPVVWTKMWGTGKIFYTSLGHHADILEAEPAHTILERGLLWAAR